MNLAAALTGQAAPAEARDRIPVFREFPLEATGGQFSGFTASFQMGHSIPALRTGDSGWPLFLVRWTIA